MSADRIELSPAERDSQAAVKLREWVATRIAQRLRELEADSSEKATERARGALRELRRLEDILSGHVSPAVLLGSTPDRFDD